MIRLNGSRPRNKLVPHSPIEESVVQIAAARLTGGLVTELDPADIDGSQGQVIKNFRIYSDKLLRAPGKSLIDVAKPNSRRVLNYMTFDRFSGVSEYIRFDRTDVYKKSSSSWTLLTAGAALTATDSDLLNFSVVNDRLFFTNGVDAIQEINTGTTAYAALGNAPKYKYICGFFNRVVGANSDTNPVLIGWSGDLNFAEWNPAVDFSAGSNPLIEGQSDYAEPITGLFGFASVMLILREKSLWIATKQASASQPFFFTAAFPGKGCDCPGSAIQTSEGIAWFDYRTLQVYSYKAGGQPEPIGTPIRTKLKDIVSDKDSVRGVYNASKNQFLLIIPSTTSSETNIFIYDYQTNSWTQDTINNCVGAYSLSDAGTVLTIGDLVGTIGDLVGTIGDLVYSMLSPPNIFYGLSDGNILQEDPLVDTVNSVAMEVSGPLSYLLSLQMI